MSQFPSVRNSFSGHTGRRGERGGSTPRHSGYTGTMRDFTYTGIDPGALSANAADRMVQELGSKGKLPKHKTEEQVKGLQNEVADKVYAKFKDVYKSDPKFAAKVLKDDEGAKNGLSNYMGHWAAGHLAKAGHVSQPDAIEAQRSLGIVSNSAIAGGLILNDADPGDEDEQVMNVEKVPEDKQQDPDMTLAFAANGMTTVAELPAGYKRPDEKENEVQMSNSYSDIVAFVMNSDMSTTAIVSAQKADGTGEVINPASATQQATSEGVTGMNSEHPAPNMEDEEKQKIYEEAARVAKENLGLTMQQQAQLESGLTKDGFIVTNSQLVTVTPYISILNSVGLGSVSGPIIGAATALGASHLMNANAGRIFYIPGDKVQVLQLALVNSKVWKRSLGEFPNRDAADCDRTVRNASRANLEAFRIGLLESLVNHKDAKGHGSEKHTISKPVKVDGEYVVKWMTGGKRDENKTYYTDDKEDAEKTHAAMTKSADELNKQNDPKTLKVGDDAVFDGTSADGTTSGFFPVKVINPHSNADKVTHESGGRQYEGAFTHIPTATVQNVRSGKNFEANHFSLRKTQQAPDAQPAQKSRYFLTEDNEFNRANSPSLIGHAYREGGQPSYTAGKMVDEKDLPSGVKKWNSFSEHKSQSLKDGSVLNHAKGSRWPVGKTASGKSIKHHQHAVYTKGETKKGFDGKASPLNDPFIGASQLQERLKDWEPEDHVDAAKAHLNAADKEAGKCADCQDKLDNCEDKEKAAGLEENLTKSRQSHARHLAVAEAHWKASGSKTPLSRDQLIMNEGDEDMMPESDAMTNSDFITGKVMPLMNGVIANSAFKLPDDGFIHLCPVGVFPHESTGLIQVVRPEDVTAMVNNFDAQKEKEGDRFSGMLIDRDHKSQTENRTDAAGWITEVQQRDDGLWGKPVFSDSGKKDVEGGEYRGISPVFKRENCLSLDENQVSPQSVFNVALTNCPNMRGMAPITKVV